MQNQERVGTCKFHRYSSVQWAPQILKRIEFTCDDLRENIDKWKSEFDYGMIRRKAYEKQQDRAYREYCEGLDKALEKCKCKEGQDDTR